MVPLVGGVWAEVKVVAIGVVERRMQKDAEQIVTTQITYFARLANAATFADQASAELRRRWIERAKQVCAIQDGAEWIQGFVQSHRHDALRILDFAHAAKYVYLRLALLNIAGEDTPFPLACSSKQTAQNNETHPAYEYTLLSWLLVSYTVRKITASRTKTSEI